MPRGTRTGLGVFLLGTLCGFLASAVLLPVLVRQDDGGTSAEGGHRAPARSALERLVDASPDDDGNGTGWGRHARRTPVGTSGDTAAVVPPPPSPEPVLDAPPASELAGRVLIIPVAGVTADQLTGSYAEQRGSRQHEAIDILAPRHTPVVAVEDGTIARLFYSQAGGITIYQFDPAERVCYYYAHLERYADALAEGQQVQQGQVIGYVGISGNAPDDTPHLHFAIFRLSSARRWWEGTPIDPFEVLGGAAAAR